MQFKFPGESSKMNSSIELIESSMEEQENIGCEELFSRVLGGIVG